MPIRVSIVLYMPSQFMRSRQTLNAIQASREHSRAAGIETELLVVHERDDAVSSAAIAPFKKSATILFKKQNETPSDAKNAVIKSARGKYIALIEAGDLFSKDWLKHAFEAAEKDGSINSIFHPEACLIFGKKLQLFTNPVIPLRSQQAEEALWANPWSSATLAHRKFLIRHPLSQENEGFGSALWCWNATAVHRGGSHKIVRETVQFAREESYLAQELLEPDWTKPVYPFQRHPIIESARSADRSSVVKTPRARLIRDEKWFLDAWREIHEIEPLLFPRYEDCKRLVEARRKPVANTALLEELLSGLSGEFDFVFVIHQLRRGGSELEALLHIEAIRNFDPKSRIAIITTEMADSDWAARLPEDVVVLEFGRKPIHSMTEPQKAALLLRLLLEIRPKTIHLKHSPTGWDVFQKAAPLLSKFSDLYASFYCTDYAADGSSVSAAYTHLHDCYPWLKAVFCDNAKFADHIRSMYGFAELRVLYFPVTIPFSKPRKKTISKKRGIRILWASRLSSQKRTGLIFKLARLLPEHQFHIYGEFSLPPALNLLSIVTTMEKFRDAVESCPNVTYHGTFEGLSSIDLKNYDLFLYTSSWDGLPNVLLEAGAAGLPVLAPNVGGIPELIGKDTGFLANNEAEYMKAIEAVVSQPRETYRRSLNLQKLIKTRHSFKAFSRRLEKDVGYFSRLTPS